MSKNIRLTAFLALVSLLLASQPFAAPSPAAGETDTQRPPFSLTMEHWKYSSKSEKMAFLFGFLSALEMEKEWQGGLLLPINKSTVGSWAKGLEGLTLDQIRENLDSYVEQNPDKKDTQVLLVLGLMYVRPKLTPIELKEAADHYAKIHGER